MEYSASTTIGEGLEMCDEPPLCISPPPGERLEGFVYSPVGERLGSFEYSSAGERWESFVSCPVGERLESAGSFCEGVGLEYSASTTLGEGLGLLGVFSQGRKGLGWPWMMRLKVG